jgi:hypothetical protein
MYYDYVVLIFFYIIRALLVNMSLFHCPLHSTLNGKIPLPLQQWTSGFVEWSRTHGKVPTKTHCSIIHHSYPLSFNGLHYCELFFWGVVHPMEWTLPEVVGHVVSAKNDCMNTHHYALLNPCHKIPVCKTSNLNHV